MACSEEDEAQCYAKLMQLQKPAGNTLKALLEYEIKKKRLSIDQVLLSHKKKILRKVEHSAKDLLFPKGKQQTNVDKWDISLFCYILRTCCMLQPTQDNDVNDVRTTRNYIAHSPKPCVSNADYAMHANVFKTFITNTLNHINDQDLKAEINEQVQEAERPVGKQVIEAYTICHKSNSSVVDDVKEHLDKHHAVVLDKFEDLEKLINTLPKESQAKLEPPNLASFKLLIKNCSPDEEEKISQVLVRIFGEHLGKKFSTLPEETCEGLKHIVGQICKELQKMVDLTEAKYGCVCITIRFYDFVSYMDFLDKSVNGKLTEIALPLQNALRCCFEIEDLQVEFVMNDEQLLDCFDHTLECLKNVYSSLMKTTHVNEQDGNTHPNNNEQSTLYSAAPVTEVPDILMSTFCTVLDKQSDLSISKNDAEKYGQVLKDAIEIFTAGSMIQSEKEQDQSPPGEAEVNIRSTKQSAESEKEALLLKGKGQEQFRAAGAERELNLKRQSAKTNEESISTTGTGHFQSPALEKGGAAEGHFKQESTENVDEDLLSKDFKNLPVIDLDPSSLGKAKYIRVTNQYEESETLLQKRTDQYLPLPVEAEKDKHYHVASMPGSMIQSEKEQDQSPPGEAEVNIRSTKQSTESEKEALLLKGKGQEQFRAAGAERVLNLKRQSAKTNEESISTTGTGHFQSPALEKGGAAEGHFKQESTENEDEDLLSKDFKNLPVIDLDPSSLGKAKYIRVTNQYEESETLLQKSNGTDQYLPLPVEAEKDKHYHVASMPGSMIQSEKEQDQSPPGEVEVDIRSTKQSVESEKGALLLKGKGQGQFRAVGAEREINLNRQTTKSNEESISTTEYFQIEDSPARDESRLYAKKRELKAQLIKYYKQSANRIAVRLDIEEAVEKLYETPKLTLKKIENGVIIEEDIPEVSQLFSTNDGKMNEKIIIEGEPGTGKTSLCKMIVADWLRGNTKVEQKPITPNLSKFEFVFFITLRAVKTESRIKAMIVKNILKSIDPVYEHEDSLLGEILTLDNCLLLLDGLDEWREEMPHVQTSWRNCTTVITTRPYKLAELKIVPTQIGKHVKLDGVQNPNNLVLKVIRMLEEINKTSKNPESCINDLKEQQLWHFSEHPGLLLHIVWLWQKNNLRDKLISTLYQQMIEERWFDMCDKKNQAKDPRELYDVLSEIAFHKMISENQDESFVFNIKGIQLEKFMQYKNASLESGILTTSYVPGKRFPQYRFLHKTFQEFFAALYVSKRGSALSTSCKLVKNIYSNHRNESVFALKQVFLFLCGLNPYAAKVFSKTLNELFTEKYENMRSAHSFQEMILRGYEEAERNGCIGEEFCLQHIVLNQWLTWNQKSILKVVLDKRKSNLESLHIDGESDLTSSLQYIGDPTILNLQSCQHLKYVVIQNIPYDDINELNLNGVLECTIRFRGYKPAIKLISSLQSSDLRSLKILKLVNVGLERKAMDIFSRLKYVRLLSLQWSKASPPNDSNLDLDHLRHLDYLETLSLKGLHFSDVVNLHMQNLQKLDVGFRTQQRAPQLMASLLQEGDGSITTFPDGTHFVIRDLRLHNILFSAIVFRRLVSLVLQSRHSVCVKLETCTIEEDIKQLPEEMENQPAFHMVVPHPASPGYETNIKILEVTLSAKMFRFLVNGIMQSGKIVDCELMNCILKPNEELRRLMMEIENQPKIHVNKFSRGEQGRCIKFSRSSVKA
ncbi:uncharacterized protein LOC128241902 isoform X2 [Mya arenaria]|uniref:uncharacterized protein LOC128241902 isoform X2 n=1 Tax=Mya arenaria TaxID=6604 RepID=UPI0022E22F9C|nr:uncharacterized protein LOC128241902 isoform X2 [Mya arenaria]